MSDRLSNPMGWSKCTVEVGLTGANDTMATTLTDIGVIKDKSSSLEYSEGDALEMKATGGITVAKEVQEGGYKLTTRVIEPTQDLLTLFGLGSLDASTSEFKMNTHIVDGDWSVKVTPKNVGARGIKAPKCAITYKPGWSEEDGNYADIDFEILKGEADYWYSIFEKPAATSAPATNNCIYYIMYIRYL